MQNTCGGGSSKLTLFVVSVVVLVLFCFAAVPSAKATVTTYSVTITGGSGGGCASGNTGLLTINSTTDTLELTSSGGCYFGTVGYDSGASTCNQTANCSTLGSLAAGQYGFNDPSGDTSNAGACTTASSCSVAATNENFQLIIPSGGFASGTTDINLASVGNTGRSVSFDDPVLVTPEPVSFLLFGSGLLVLGAIFRKKLGLCSGAV
jgi:hypothetical protein